MGDSTTPSPKGGKKKKRSQGGGADGGTQAAHGTEGVPKRDAKHKQGKGGGGARRGGAHDPTHADRSLASSAAEWYAGAAFELSPDPDTLPRPERLLATLNLPSAPDLSPAAPGPSAGGLPAGQGASPPPSAGAPAADSKRQQLDALGEHIRQMLQISRQP